MYYLTAYSATLLDKIVYSKSVKMARMKIQIKKVSKCASKIPRKTHRQKIMCILIV